MTTSGETRVQRWERRGEWPLAVAAALFLAAYAWPILDQGLSPAWRTLCRWTVVIRLHMAIPLMGPRTALTARLSCLASLRRLILKRRSCSRPLHSAGR